MKQFPITYWYFSITVSTSSDPNSSEQSTEMIDQIDYNNVCINK